MAVRAASFEDMSGDDSDAASAIDPFPGLGYGLTSRPRFIQVRLAMVGHGPNRRVATPKHVLAPRSQGSIEGR